MKKSDILGGDTISYIVVFGKAQGLAIAKGGQDVFTIMDQYCMNPICDCDEAVLIFNEIATDVEFAIRLSLTKKRYETLDVFGVSEQQVDQIVKEELKDNEVMNLLRQRYQDMKLAGQESLKKATEKAKQAKQLLEQKPKRNEPCTCGSGKKYKKCCGMNEGTTR